MKYQGGGLAKRSRFGGIAKYAAKGAMSLVPYGRQALALYRGARKVSNFFKKSRPDSNNNDRNPSAPVETGYAVGHSAFTTTRRQKRMSKKAFKKKARWEVKVRAAVTGSAKFQQYFQNCILGPTAAVDVMSWWEIPIMAGKVYAFPGTSTDANNILYRVNNDEGDFVPAADIALNATTSRQLMSGQTPVYTAVSGTNSNSASAKFVVYGYSLEYNVQNIQTVPITVEIFEVTCIKDYVTNGSNAVFSTGNESFSNPTGSMMSAANAANVTREAAVAASGTQIAVSNVAVGVTPFLFRDVGEYMRVVRSHVHVLDPSQILRLQKVYKFKRPIAVQDLSGVVFKKGVSHVICGSVRSTAIGAGNYAGPLAGVAAGAGGFTHSYVVNYNKRFIIKPLDTGNNSLGMRNQVL